MAFRRLPTLDSPNVYNRVDVRLSSHDAGGITDRDLALAKTLDEVETG